MSERQNLRAKHCAVFLGVAESTFWRWVQQGKLPKGIRLSTRATVWPREVLEGFLQRQQQMFGDRGE